MGSRFLDKRFIRMDGFGTTGDDADPALLFEGGKLVTNRPMNVEGDFAATGATVNSMKVKGGGNLTALWQVVATWNMGAVPGAVGSTNTVISTDVAMSGAAIGDLAFAVPIGSVALDVHWDAAIYSANAVNLRGRYTGSTGAYTPGNVPFKVVVLKL